MSDDLLEHGDRWVNINQVMEIAGVSRRTIYNWVALGKLTRYETPMGKARFKRSDLIKERREDQA